MKIEEMLKELRPEQEQEFSVSKDFIEDGLLDSFDTLQLVDMIEEEYGISVDGIDLIPENFVSIDTIEALIKKSGGTVHK